MNATNKTSKQVAELLGSVLMDDSAAEILPTQSIRSFQSAGVLTNNDGLVIRLPDGTEYQITVVRSK